MSLLKLQQVAVWLRNRPPYREPEPKTPEDVAVDLAHELGFPPTVDAQFYVDLFTEIKNLRARIAKLEEKK